MATSFSSLRMIKITDAVQLPRLGSGYTVVDYDDFDSSCVIDQNGNVVDPMPSDIREKKLNQILATLDLS